MSSPEPHASQRAMYPRRDGAWPGRRCCSPATLVSRLLGLVREQVFAALLGAGFMAMRSQLPSVSPTYRDLFAEGALSAAFSARVSSRARKRRSRHRRSTIAGQSGRILPAGGPKRAGHPRRDLCPQDGRCMGDRLWSYRRQAELTVRLTRIMMPFLLLVSLAALAMGMLNAEGRFTHRR